MMKVLQKYKKKGEKVPETVFGLKMYRSAKESFIHMTKTCLVIILIDTVLFELFWINLVEIICQQFTELSE